MSAAAASRASAFREEIITEAPASAKAAAMALPIPRLAPVMIATFPARSGYVEVESQAFISGGVVVHQFSKIGRLAMVGGNTRVNSDLPPYFLYSDFNVSDKGVNVVGVKRANFSQEEIGRLKAAYRLLYRTGLKTKDALSRIEAEAPSEHTLHLVDFVRRSKRGICREATTAKQHGRSARD